MNRLDPSRLEQMRQRWVLRPRRRVVRAERTHIKYAPWWSPWRGWVLLVAWFFFAKHIAFFRWMWFWMFAAFLLAWYVSGVRYEDGTWTYCVLWGNPCYR